MVRWDGPVSMGETRLGSRWDRLRVESRCERLGKIGSDGIDRSRWERLDREIGSNDIERSRWERLDRDSIAMRETEFVQLGWTNAWISMGETLK